MPSASPPAPILPRAEEESGGEPDLLVDLEDILPSIPTRFLKPGMHDSSRQLRFRMEELVGEIARGRPLVPVSRLAELCPDVFEKPATPAEDVPIRLPLQKLIQQLGRAGDRSRPARVPPLSPMMAPPPEVVVPPVEAPAVEPIPTADRPKVEELPLPIVETSPAPLEDEIASPAPTPDPVVVPEEIAIPIVTVNEPPEEKPTPEPPATPVPEVSPETPPAPLGPIVFPLARPRLPGPPPPILSTLVGGITPAPTPIVVAAPPVETVPEPLPVPPAPKLVLPPVAPPPAPLRPAPVVPGLRLPVQAPSPEPATPAPVSGPVLPRLFATPAPTPRQDTLQTLYLTEETLDLPAICRLATALPGLRACRLVSGEAITTHGSWPTEDALKQTEATLRAAKATLSEAEAITAHFGEYALTLFQSEATQLWAIHAARGFLPGVREKLLATVRAL